MLRFSKRLASKGVLVTFATPEVTRKQLLNITQTVDECPGIHLEFFSDGLSLDLNRGEHVDLMLASLPVEDVAAEHGIPCAMLYIQAFALYAIYYRYKSLENVPNEALEVPGLPLLEVNDLPTFILPSSPHHFRKLVADSVHSMEKVKWVLGSSFYELEADVVQSMSFFKPILPIGPLMSSVVGEVNTCDAGDSCLKWLDEKLPSSVVYIAFGSIIMLTQKQMQNIAMALKNMNRPFLWVVRSPEKEYSEKKNGELPFDIGSGLVVSWCNQEKVLRHQAVACFLSHCGWNSTLEAVVAGVPVIAFPEWTDQPTNAKLLVDVFKMGVRMRPEDDGTVTKEEVERCIFEITEGPRASEMKKRAMDLREAAKKAVADGGSSDRNVDHFISEIINQSGNTL
ncbi:hypothetical protein F0562_006635 [Nyssa sinensis]|uniref:Uncharacterized protein n=1 Tax=Nyssa sinensis TaxID=561372 RepID=A0A5J5AN52_9ASTE|nr:hypothetical protein F0562_006635 [Nyssa sinensis]